MCCFFLNFHKLLFNTTIDYCRRAITFEMSLFECIHLCTIMQNTYCVSMSACARPIAIIFRLQPRKLKCNQNSSSMNAKFSYEFIYIYRQKLNQIKRMEKISYFVYMIFFLRVFMTFSRFSSGLVSSLCIQFNCSNYIEIMGKKLIEMIFFSRLKDFLVFYQYHTWN